MITFDHQASLFISLWCNEKITHTKHHIIVNWRFINWFVGLLSKSSKLFIRRVFFSARRGTESKKTTQNFYRCVHNFRRIYRAQSMWADCYFSCRRIVWHHFIGSLAISTKATFFRHYLESINNIVCSGVFILWLRRIILFTSAGVIRWHEFINKKICGNQHKIVVTERHKFLSIFNSISITFQLFHHQHNTHNPFTYVAIVAI